MSAEFPASRAKEFTINRDELNAERWYAGFKDVLFERITSAALDGDISVTLGSFEWHNIDANKRYLTNRLEKLGYTVVGNLTISW